MPSSTGGWRSGCGRRYAARMGEAARSRTSIIRTLHYYAEPKQKKTINSPDDLDPEISAHGEKPGIPIEEQKVLAGVEGARRWRSTRCSTASRSRPPSARS